MTKEAFIELVIEKAHEAWQWKEQGYKVDLNVFLGRIDSQTGEEREPDIRVDRRGWGKR